MESSQQENWSPSFCHKRHIPQQDTKQTPKTCFTIHIVFNGDTVWSLMSFLFYVLLSQFSDYSKITFEFKGKCLQGSI